MWWKKKKEEKQDVTVTFATSCWKGDWKKILEDQDYLATMQIANHDYPFLKKMVVINNVDNLSEVKQLAKKRKEEGIITDYFVAQEHAKKVLDFFHLKKEGFKKGSDAHLYENVTDDWIYYNAIGVLTAIYFCDTDYFLYHTGDSYLKKKVSWIDKAIDLMEKKQKYKVANLAWNEKYDEVQKESKRCKKDFYVADRGFSDQFFLVRTKDFQQPIYQEIRNDSHHFPRGDVFEKRVFSYMINHGWKRLTYRYGSYFHE